MVAITTILATQRGRGIEKKKTGENGPWATHITPRELEVTAPLSDLGGVLMSPPRVYSSWLVCLCAEINQGA